MSIGALVTVVGSMGAVHDDGAMPAVVHASAVHSSDDAAAYMLPQEVHMQIWVPGGKVYPMPEKQLMSCVLGTVGQELGTVTSATAAMMTP